ncbi:uncharacterized protein LOC144114073 [Amblyomma americanum]
MPTPFYSGDEVGGNEQDWNNEGFRARVQDTLRLLTALEQLPGTDPMLLDVLRFLILQELVMDLNSVLNQQAAEGEPAMPEPADEAPFSIGSAVEEATRQMYDQLRNRQEEEQPSDLQSHLAAVSSAAVPHVNSDHSGGQKTPPTAEPNPREPDC